MNVRLLNNGTTSAEWFFVTAILGLIICIVLAMIVKPLDTVWKPIDAVWKRLTSSQMYKRLGLPNDLRALWTSGTLLQLGKGKEQSMRFEMKNRWGSRNKAWTIFANISFWRGKIFERRGGSDASQDLAGRVTSIDNVKPYSSEV